MESELVTKELAKFDIVEAGLATLETRYLALKVVGVDDKDGAAIVHKARIDVKGRRIAVVKDGEEMRKDAIAWQKKVIGRVNEIVSRCERMEAHLQAEEDIVENEKARKKAEAEAKEAARFQSRIDVFALSGLPMTDRIIPPMGWFSRRRWSRSARMSSSSHSCLR